VLNTSKTTTQPTEINLYTINKAWQLHMIPITLQLLTQKLHNVVLAENKKATKVRNHRKSITAH